MLLRPLPSAALLALLMTVAAGRGGGSESAAKDPVNALAPSVRDKVKTAETVNPSSFPKPKPGESLEQLADQFDTQGPQAVAASSVLRPPSNRIAFGLLDENQRFAYGKTVIYVQPR